MLKLIFSRNSPKIVPYVVIFLFSFLFYFNNLCHMMPSVFDKNNVILNSDTKDTFDMITSPSRNIWMKSDLEFFQPELSKRVVQDIQKHPMFFIITRGLYQAFKFAFFKEKILAVSAVLAFISAMNILLAFVVLNVFVKNVKISVLFTLFYGLSFSNIVFFSIPETYGLTASTVIVYSFFLIRWRDNLTLKRIVVFISITIIAPFFNLPLVLLMVPNFIVFIKILKFKRGFLLALMNVSLVFLVYFFYQIIFYGSHSIIHLSRYSRDFISFSFITSIKDVLFYVANFLLFAVLSPISRLINTLNFQNLSMNLSLRGIILLIVYLFFLFFSFIQLIKKRDIILDSLAIWIALMIGFYMLFNPWESMLYSSQILFPVTLILAAHFGKLNIRFKYHIFILFLLAVALNNIICIYRPLDIF